MRLKLGCLLLLPSLLLAQGIFSPTAKRIALGTTLPATCGIGGVFYKSTATAGFYVCVTQDTWTLVLNAAATGLFANGTGGAPGISFVDGVTGFFRVAENSIGTKDSDFELSASGTLTDVKIDNDKWVCREGDESQQRGICQILAQRKSNNARFFELIDTFVSWGDPAGGGSGNRIGVGRFTSEGATAAKLYVATSDGGTVMPIAASAFVAAGTIPAVTVCGTIGTGSKNDAGFITSATGACAPVLTFTVTAPTGWSCAINNSTTPANIFQQTASSATTATFTGVSVANDVLRYLCTAY